MKRKLYFLLTFILSVICFTTCFIGCKQNKPLSGDYVVIVANDASDHTWRRAKSFVAGTEQQCIRVPFSKEELGFVVGRTSLAIAAFTDAALALAFVKALPNPEKFKEVAEQLDIKAKKLRQRKDEAKAHERNVRKGKK